MSLKIFSILITLFPFFCFAQSNYKKALLVTNNGDSLYGLINYREWHANPESISFKPDGEDKPVQSFTPVNTRSFTIFGYESYNSFTVSISKNQVSLSLAGETVDTSTTIEKVFLREILKGDRVTLYSYQDKLKLRYYILDKSGDTPEELLYRVSMVDLQEKTEAIYRQQLAQAATKYNVFNMAFDNVIQNTGYFANDLKNAVSKINTVNSQASTIGKSKGRVGFFVGVGLHRDQITYTGKTLVTIDGITSSEITKYKDEVVTTGYLPRINAGVDFYIDPSIKKFVVRTEMAGAQIKSETNAYSKTSNYTTDETYYNYKLSGWNISFIPQLQYNFYNNSKFKAYVAAGGALSYFIIGKNSLKQSRKLDANDITYDNDYLNLRQTSLRAILKGGVQIGNLVDLSFIYGSSAENSNTGSATSSLMAFSAAILFKK